MTTAVANWPCVMVCACAVGPVISGVRKVKVQVGGDVVPLPLPVTTLPFNPFAATIGVARVVETAPGPKVIWAWKISAWVFGDASVGAVSIVTLSNCTLIGFTVPLLLAP